MAGSSPSKRVRRGLSFLEFLGCFSALLGGLAIGSMYLGIDLKTTLLAVVQHAQGQPITIPKSQDSHAAPPADAPPKASSGLTAESSPPVPPAATAAATEEPERTANAADPAPPEKTAETAAEPPQAAALVEAITLTDDQRRQLTDAYWAALNECLDAELARRSTALGGSGDWDLYHYLTTRHEGHRQAAEAIAKLHERGVDAHVAAYGAKARQWHQEGATLYARAKDLLTDAPTAQLNGPFAQSWQSAATQHQMEERLLAEKRSAVQAYLDHHREQSATAPADDAGP
ncbi:MAG: hypothetical protein DCC67_15860 [Planctomycetota bacterium]|nr:MAG: hypothetical protein DCC67_15860 [Planctomycetota bacterium]